MGLDADRWAAIATAAGAANSLGAAGFAYWQARIARVAKDATINQAATARAALELQREDRDRRDAPQFALKTDPATADYSAHVEVRMIGGRAAGRERHLDHGDYPVEGHG